MVKVTIFVCEICGRGFKLVDNGKNPKHPDDCEHIMPGKYGILRDNLKPVWSGPVGMYQSGKLVVGQQK